MWRYLLCGILVLVILSIVTVKIITSQIYNIYMKYKKVINLYKDKFKGDLSNELVYQYISDIDALPKVEKVENLETFIKFYELINNDKKISNDLKFQLKVALNLKGIRV